MKYKPFVCIPAIASILSIMVILGIFLTPVFAEEFTEKAATPLIYDAKLSDGRKIYAVCLEDYDALDAIFYGIGLYQGQQDFCGGDDGGQAYFMFSRPIKNCLFFQVPAAITCTGEEGFSDVKWAGVFHIADEDTWVIGEDYDYSDGQFANVTIAPSDPIVLDGVTVLPVDAPRGFDSFIFEVSFTSAIIGFSDKESAVAFAEVMKLRDTADSQHSEKDEESWMKEPETARERAYQLYNYDKRDEAKKIFEDLAAYGDPSAQFILATDYRNDYSAEENLARIKASAELGYAPAIYQMGIMYEGGNSVEQDDAEAAKCFSTAADMFYSLKEEDITDPEIAYIIGNCYYYGDGQFEQDMEKAKLWFEKASDLGEPKAALMIGRMLFYGTISGTTDELNHWMQSAMLRGEAEGYFYCACMILNGDAEGDVDALMQAGAERGSYSAQFYLNTGSLLLFQ